MQICTEGNACTSESHVIEVLHKVVLKVRIAVLIVGCFDGIISMQLIIHMILLPRQFFPLFCQPGFFLGLSLISDIIIPVSYTHLTLPTKRIV